MIKRTIHIWFADGSYWRTTTKTPVSRILAEARVIGEIVKWEIEVGKL